MINQLEENLEKFIPTEMWRPTHYQWLLDFLDQQNNRKIFFWVDDKEGLTISYSIPPKYYGKLQDSRTSSYFPPYLI